MAASEPMAASESSESGHSIGGTGPDAVRRSAFSIGPEDWPATAADHIVAGVGKIRSHTVDNLALVVRAMVYGLAAVTVCVFLAVLAVVSAVRMLDAYLPIGDGVGSATWAAHGFAGTLSLVLGLGAWRARSSTARPIVIAIVVNIALIVSTIAYGVLLRGPVSAAAADAPESPEAQSESADPGDDTRGLQLSAAFGAFDI